MMASVYVDIDNFLYDASEKALSNEIVARIRSGKWKSPIPALEDVSHPWTALGIAADLRSAFYARNASRFEAILSVLEPAPTLLPRLKAVA